MLLRLPPPGTNEEWIYHRLINRLTRRRIGIQLDEYQLAARLAKVILDPELGHRSPLARAMAEALKIDFDRLPTLL
jgi:hypothetical protein